MIEAEGTDIVLDTGVDVLIYRAPRPETEDDRRYQRGRDLFVKERAGGPDIYYMHSWSLLPGEQEGIRLVTMNAAERFLEGRGLVLASYPGSTGSAILRSYGYGMLEEF